MSAKHSTTAATIQHLASSLARPLRQLRQRMRATCREVLRVPIMPADFDADAEPKPVHIQHIAIGNEEVPARSAMARGGLTTELRQFQNRLNLATDCYQVEQLRRDMIFPTGTPIWKLANDHCDDRIYDLTGHKLRPVAVPHHPKIHPSKNPPIQKSGGVFIHHPDDAHLFQGATATDTFKLTVGQIITGIMANVAEPDLEQAIALSEGLTHELRKRHHEQMADEAGNVGN